MLSGKPKLQTPTTSLDVQGLNSRDRMEAWRQFNTGLFSLDFKDPTRSDFQASALSYRIGETILGRYSVTENVVRRTISRLSIEREDLLVIRMHLSGQTKGVMNGRDFLMQADRITMFDFHQSIEAHTNDVDYLSLTVPFSTVGYDPSRHPHLMQFPISSPFARVVGANLQQLIDLAPQSSVADATTISEGLVNLLRTFIAGTVPDQPTEECAVSTKIAIRRYIQANLRNPNLTVDGICNAMHVQQRDLYGMFEVDGGVRRFISRLRLEGAYEELSYTEPMRGAVARIAGRWTYPDQAYFSKLFHENFGVRPTDALGTNLQVSGTLSVGKSATTTSSEPLISLY
ncbi:MAG: hypothetical protein AB3N23_13565 [Paracoccaceae bacterium]